MATANFPLVETTKYFCLGHYDEEREAWDEWNWQIYWDEVNEMITSRFGECKQFSIRRDYESGNHFGTWTEWMKFGGRELPVTMNLYLRSGHYSGACFDFDTLQVEDEVFEVRDDIEADEMTKLLEWIFRYEDYSAGWCKMQAQNFARRVDEIRDKMIREIETVFEELCEEKLQVSCRFSNGEVWYDRCA